MELGKENLETRPLPRSSRTQYMRSVTAPVRCTQSYAVSCRTFYLTRATWRTVRCLPASRFMVIPALPPNDKASTMISP